jgi:hypothetical protein
VGGRQLARAEWVRASLVFGYRRFLIVVRRRIHQQTGSRHPTSVGRFSHVDSSIVPGGWARPDHGNDAGQKGSSTNPTPPVKRSPRAITANGGGTSPTVADRHQRSRGSIRHTAAGYVWPTIRWSRLRSDWAPWGMGKEAPAERARRTGFTAPRTKTRPDGWSGCRETRSQGLGRRSSSLDRRRHS